MGNGMNLGSTDEMKLISVISFIRTLRVSYLQVAQKKKRLFQVEEGNSVRTEGKGNNPRKNFSEENREMLVFPDNFLY